MNSSYRELKLLPYFLLAVFYWGISIFDYLSRANGQLFNLTTPAFYFYLTIRLVLLSGFPALLILIYSRHHERRSPSRTGRTFDRHLVKDKPTSQLFVFASIIANIICFAYLPGAYTGDAKLLISIATESSAFTDLFPPAITLLFKWFYILSGGKVGFFMLFQVYTAVYATVFLTHRLLLLIPKLPACQHPDPNREILPSIILSLVLMCNPVFLGFVTLLYIDVVFTATYLFACILGINAYLGNAYSKPSNILGFLSVIILTALLRHNGLFLLPGFILMSTLLIQRYETKLAIFSKFFPVFVFASFLIVGMTLLAKKTTEELLVEHRLNYYIAVPVYELLGTYHDFEETRADLAWMSNYMDLEAMSTRYGKYNAVIPIFWTGRDMGLVDMNAIYTDHALILRKYLHALVDHPSQLIKTKYKHFVYTLGSKPFWRSPFFSDYKDWSLQTPRQTIDRKQLGIEPNWISSALVSRSQNLAMRSETSGMRFVLVSPIFYIFMLVTFIIPYLFLSRNPAKWYVLAVMLSAVGYLGGYLVATHGGFVKYVFPAQIVIQAMSLIVIYRTASYLAARTSGVNQDS